MRQENSQDLDRILGNKHDQAFFAQAGELTEAEKQRYISKAKRIKKAIDIVVAGLFILSFFHFSPYIELMFYLSVFVYFYLSYSNSSLIRIHFGQTELPNALYSVWIIMMLSGLLLLYKVIDHQDIARYLMIVLAFSCLLFILLCITANMFRAETTVTQLFGLLFLSFSLMFFYSMSFICFLNVFGEQRVVHSSSYIIINKDYSSSRRGPSRHYFDLKTESGTVLRNIDVPSSHFNSKQIGDEYQIQTYKGNLGIAWTPTNGY
ncbi:hypothetical protein [Acinetobacter tianfuensis]|uniref:hypothetical protein n=1 Tax=Acinetobacter tianfuensis TaxID=2419603 RepID=UPI0011C4169F|nr:hypothetical protein [Acinetobacter tianfuensis]